MAARLTDAQKVERFIARKGVTKCPPAYLEPVRLAIPSSPSLRHYENLAELRWKNRKQGKRTA
jgi:hypothetical protein